MAEHGYRGGIERQQTPGVRLQPEPAGGEDAQQVGVAEQQAATARGNGLFKHPAGALGDLCQRFACGDGCRPGAERRLCQADLVGGAPLVLAVVPFTQIIEILGTRAETCQRRRFACPGQRAAPDPVERPVRQQGGELPGAGAALCAQRDITAPGMTSVARPLGFSVADQPQLGSLCNGVFSRLVKMRRG